MISVSYVQRRMRLLLTVALVVISQQASTFTLPRKVDEPFGGLLHTMVIIIYICCRTTDYKTCSKLSFYLVILSPSQLQKNLVVISFVSLFKLWPCQMQTGNQSLMNPSDK